MSDSTQEPAPFPSPVKNYHRSSYPSIDPSRPKLSSKGKNVLITGGGSGIGAEIAKTFAQSGAANIALIGRTKNTLDKTKASVSASFPSTNIHVYTGDITDAASIANALQGFAKDVQGKIDVLIANAGYLHSPDPLLSVDADDWWRTYEINVKGAFNLVRAAVPLLAENAVVENVTSAAGQIQYMPGHSAYQGSKLGALKVFDALAGERPELTVITWHPGVLDTQMYELSKTSGVVLPEDDISLPASFAVWAASPEAQFLSGKFVWAHWDVDELKSMEEKIKGTPTFTISLIGGQEPLPA